MTQRLITTLVLTVSFTASPAIAQQLPTSQSIENLQKCYEIQSDSERLTCYDLFAKTFQTNVEDGSVVVVDKEAIESQIEDDFGLNNNNSENLREALNIPSVDTEQKDDDAITVKITEAKKLSNRKYRFYLENGQVWEQTDSAYVYFPKNNENIATIKSGALGSFKLRVNGKGRSIRVRRIK